MTCKAALESARRITLLREKLIFKAQSASRSSNPAKLTDELFKHPYITIAQAAKLIESTPQGGANVIAVLVENGILKETMKSGRTRIFAFRPYLDLLHETSDDLSSAIGQDDSLRRPIGTEISDIR